MRENTTVKKNKYKSRETNKMVKRQKLVILTIGAILLIVGMLWTIFLGLDGRYIYGFIVTGLFVIIGLLLIVFALGD